MFGEKVRAAYLDVYGDNPFNEENPHAEKPFTLGTVVVGIDVSHVDGESTSIMVYDGNRMTALGLASRTCRILEGDD